MWIIARYCSVFPLLGNKKQEYFYYVINILQVVFDNMNLD